jgi:type VI protein secretion system component Hcp
MRGWTLTAVAVLALARVAFAADPPAGFVRIDGMRGESRSKPGWIEALTLTINCGHLESGQTAHAGATRTLRLIFTHRVDRTSALLLKAGATSQQIPKAYVEQSGARYELTEVQVSRVAKIRAGEGPAEAVTLNFARCTRQ